MHHKGEASAILGHSVADLRRGQLGAVAPIG